MSWFGLRTINTIMRFIYCRSLFDYKAIAGTLRDGNYDGHIIATIPTIAPSLDNIFIDLRLWRSEKYRRSFIYEIVIRIYLIRTIFAELMKNVLKKFFKIRKNNYIIYVAEKLSDLKLLHSDLHFHLGEFDLKSIERVFANKEPDRYKLFNKFFQAGYLGIYIDHDQQIMAYGWGTVYRGNGRFFSNNHFPLKKAEGHIFYCFTEEAFRHHNLYSIVIYSLSQRLFAQGASRIWIDTNDDNLPAQKGILHVGFHPYGKMTNILCCNHLIFSKVKTDREE